MFYVSGVQFVIPVAGLDLSGRQLAEATTFKISDHLFHTAGTVSERQHGILPTTRSTTLQPALWAICNAINCPRRLQGGLQGCRLGCMAICRAAVPTTWQGCTLAIAYSHIYSHVRVTFEQCE